MMHRNWLAGDLIICILGNKSSYRNHFYYVIPLCKYFFLINFKEDGLESKFRTDTVVSDRDSGRVVNRNFRQIYLQFPYFTKELDECSTLSDKLMYALKNMNNWNRMPDALKEQVFSHLDQHNSVCHRLRRFGLGQQHLCLCHKNDQHWQKYLWLGHRLYQNRLLHHL